MIKITDEMLMSYADGELDKNEAAEIEKLLKNDAELAAKVSRHHALRSEFDLAFNDIDNTPMPDSVMELLQQDKSNVINLDEHKAKRNMKWWQPSAIAASIAVAFVIGMGTSVSTVSDGDLLTVNNQLAALFDSTATGTSSEDITLQGSFLKSDGSLCRTFQYTASEQPTDGLSCRELNGQWKVVTLVPGVPADAYLPASGETESIIDQLTNEMQELSTEEEKSYFK